MPEGFADAERLKILLMKGIGRDKAELETAESRTMSEGFAGAERLKILLMEGIGRDKAELE